MNYTDAMVRAQRVSRESGCCQCVNRSDAGAPGEYVVSDWYDSDSTVQVFNNGREGHSLPENKWENQ